MRSYAFGELALRQGFLLPIGDIAFCFVKGNAEEDHWSALAQVSIGIAFVKNLLECNSRSAHLEFENKNSSVP